MTRPSVWGHHGLHLQTDFTCLLHTESDPWTGPTHGIWPMAQIQGVYLPHRARNSRAHHPYSEAANFLQAEPEQPNSSLMRAGWLWWCVSNGGLPSLWVWGQASVNCVHAAIASCFPVPAQLPTSWKLPMPPRGRGRRGRGGEEGESGRSIDVVSRCPTPCNSPWAGGNGMCTVPSAWPWWRHRQSSSLLKLEGRRDGAVAQTKLSRSMGQIQQVHGLYVTDPCPSSSVLSASHHTLLSISLSQ